MEKFSIEIIWNLNKHSFYKHQLLSAFSQIIFGLLLPRDGALK